jgi:hypothetical protein
MAHHNEAALKRALRELRRESAEWKGLEEGTLETTENLLAALFSEIRNLPQPRFEMDEVGILVYWRCLARGGSEIAYLVEGRVLRESILGTFRPTTLEIIVAGMRAISFVNHGVPKGKLKAL